MTKNSAALKSDEGEMKPPMCILLVEDDIVDVKHIKRGLEKIKASHQLEDTLNVVNNGTDALNSIYGRDNTPAMDRLPQVILLDIKLPKMSGFDFLRELRADSRFSKLPVFIVSGSDAESDKTIAKSLNVAGFFTKPLDFKLFTPLLVSLAEEYARN